MASLRKSRPKLKDSCDNCASAKVRCSKEKPACHRCDEKGYLCVYSFSCRAGRHLVKGDKASPPIGDLVSPSMTASPTFTYPLATDPSSGYLDTSASFALSGSQPVSRHDSFTGTYGCSNYYASPTGGSGYQALPYTLAQSDLLMGTHSSPTSYAPLQHSRSNSQSVRSNSSGSLYTQSTVTTPSALTLNTLGTTQDASWSPSHTGVGVSPSGGQCIMGENQNCLIRLLGAFGLQPGEFPPPTDFSLTGPASIINSSNMLNRVFETVNDPVAINKTVLNLATSTLACSCSVSDPQLQQLLVAVAFNVMARYSAFAFHSDDAASFQDLNFKANRARFVLDELHRVSSFLDSLDRRLQASQNEAHYRRTSSSSRGSVTAGMENSYGIGANSAASAAYPCSSASSSSSSGMGSPDYCLDPGFVFSAVELRRRLQGLRNDIVSRMGSG